MGRIFEYAEESSLLCAEEDTSIFDDVDDNCEGVVDFQISDWEFKDHTFLFSGGFNLDTLQIPTQDCLASMFQRETQHLPALDYPSRFRIGDLDLSARKLAIDWIDKVKSHYNFGPLSFYLAVNYMDRFLSAYELPKGKTWMMQLLAVSCLSLAVKMEESDVPMSLDLQVSEAKFIFEAKTIQKMELLVLSTLKWRMQSVTPFSFIDYFLSKINEDQKSPKSLLFQSIQLILSTIKGIDFLEFKPSEIAAAVAISVTEENPIVALSFLSHNVQQERVVKCVEMMHDLRWSNSIYNNRGSTTSSSSVPQSPNGVLDAAACLSYSNKSDDASTISTPSSAHSSPLHKRRKLDRNFNI